MKNKTSVIISSIVMLIGIGTVAFELFVAFNIFLFILGCLLVVVSILFIKNQFNKLVTIEDQTFEWYKAKYPHNVQGDLITCFTCESNSIDIRPFQHETFQNKIYCTQCEKTLYYSK